MTKLVGVTGPLGFIGQYVVELLLRQGHYVYAVDAETYAANRTLLPRWRDWLEAGTLRYVKGDIVTLTHLPELDAIVNLAAETHVDNSIMDPRAFLRTNLLGVQNLLELVRGRRNYQMPRFVQISTDEVYGDVAAGATDETAPLRPSSPYAASKAAADALVQSYTRTYGVPANIIRPSNVYGIGQYPEKLIPKAIRYRQLGKPFPLHAGGVPVRSWLAVEDCAAAIVTVLHAGAENAIYNVGGNTDASVGEIVAHIGCDVDVPCERAGLDRRYHVSDDPLRALGWVPQGNLWADLPSIETAEAAGFRW